MKRTALATSSVVAMVVGILGAAQPAVAVPNLQVTAETSVDCEGEQAGFYVTATNPNTESINVLVDVDSDGDGQANFGDGFPVEAGQTFSLPYFVDDGEYGVVVYTELGGVLDETVVVDCVATASELLAELTVATEDATQGYDRELFPHWTDADNDGCDTRDEVLIAESTAPVNVGSECSLSGGSWTSVYDGVVTSDASTLDVDHMIPLKEAWDSGAARWSTAQREQFANDLGVDYALIAVSASSNRSKSDSDPAEWWPADSAYQCTYATDWALMKYRWALTIDDAEFSALAAALSGECGSEEVQLPEVLASHTPAPTPTPTPTPTGFLDVPTSQVFFDEISWLANTGVTTGWSVSGGREFRPYQNVNRDVMAAFLYRLAGSPAYTAPGSSPFRDVPTSHVFYKEISWLAETGVTTGWNVPGGREFRPYQSVKRDVMAAFLYRFAGEPTYAPAYRSPFKDVPTSHVFYKEISWLADTGITTGWSVSGGREFRPTTSVKRDVMAAFLYRYEEEANLSVDGYPGDAVNCSDFSRWRDAQGWFEHYRPYFGDVAQLDGDGNGIACQSLPGAP